MAKLEDTNFTGIPDSALAPIAKSDKAHHKPVFASFEMKDDFIQDPVAKLLTESLQKSAENTMAAIRRGAEIVELGFKEDPIQAKMATLYKPKLIGIPNTILKILARGDDLVAAVLNTRGNHVSAFGHELQDRFSTGFRIEPNKGVAESLDVNQKKSLLQRIQKVSKVLARCGYERGYSTDHQLTFSSFLSQQARNGLLFGYFATEIDLATDDNGTKVFRGFRPLDAGTIYAAQPNTDSQAAAVRAEALKMLEKVTGRELTPEAKADRDFAWFQVHEGRYLQAFTAEELIVTNLYPTTDIEAGGYPITPIDTCIAAVTTHMNITTHNKLYFQNGRAARGMIIIRSPDVDQGLADTVKQHFNATANGVRNSWRVPVFGLDPNDNLEWVPIELQGGRDAEFQYLSDQNARTILSAFQMSPEELPGYQHLTRGSNSQALSESSNEYKLLAARDVGIRPLLAHFQDFINLRILPLVDAEVAKHCTLKFYGLDAENEEKEATRIAAEQPLHLTYNEILNRVEKDALPGALGGDFPLNPSYQAILDKYFTVGYIKEFFFKTPNASKDPTLQYYRDPFWFEYQNLLMQQAQQVQQAQLEQQQLAMAAQEPQEDQQSEDDADGPHPDSQGQNPEATPENLGKSERQLSPDQRRILAQQELVIRRAMGEFKRDAQTTLAQVVRTAKAYKPKK